MVKAVVALLLVVSFFLPFVSADNRGNLTESDKLVRQQLRDSTVKIVAGLSAGTGSLIKRGDVTFVLTAAHVVGECKAPVIKETVFENDKFISETSVELSILVVDKEADLALLRVNQKGYGKCGIVFNTDKDPTIDTLVLHCGNFMGVYLNIVRMGYIDKVGLSDNTTLYDMADFVSLPGSSGGPVILSNGKYIGLLAGGAGETCSLYIPLRRIKTWAKSKELDWLFETKAKIPDKFLAANK